MIKKLSKKGIKIDHWSLMYQSYKIIYTDYFFLIIVSNNFMDYLI